MTNETTTLPNNCQAFNLKQGDMIKVGGRTLRITHVRKYNSSRDGKRVYVTCSSQRISLPWFRPMNRVTA